MRALSRVTSRSWLFTPATRPDRLAKRPTGADVVIIDLEDSVSMAEKQAARDAALRYLASDLPPGPLSALRINGLETRAGIADLDALLGVSAWPDLLVLPKVETGHLLILDRLLTAAGTQIGLIGIVESAAGLADVERAVVASARLAGLMFGAADLAADLGVANSWEPLAFARSRLVAACALRGIVPIDAPFFAIDDKVGLQGETERAVSFGFQAKAAIHPGQLSVINATLTPTETEIAAAKAILAENAKGVGIVDGQMVDAAIARKARKVLMAAGRSG